MHNENNLKRQQADSLKVFDNKYSESAKQKETPLKDGGTKNVETTKPKSKVSIE